MIYLIKRSPTLLALLFFWVGGIGRLEAEVTASSLAIIGYDDFSDSFSIMALDTWNAGEVIYFTNNGWNNALGSFHGADASQGAGSESLIKLTLNQSITKGMIIGTDVTDDAWEWTKSGLIPGQTGGFAEFSNLALDYESDQIYAFQGLSENPLLNPTHFIYALHFGSIDYPDFTDYEDSMSGDIPPGLSLEDKTAFAHTNFTLHGDADGNHPAWGLNMDDPDIQFLNAEGGTNFQWLNAIANSDNWVAVEPMFISPFAAPEPSRTAFLLVGLAAAALKRRKSKILHKLW
jgi:hypothetical protein